MTAVAPASGREPGGSTRTTFALSAAVASGVAISLQVFVNGRLAGTLGSPVLAGTVNNVSALVLLIAIGAAGGVPRRARTGLKTRSKLRWWHVAAGLNGALFVTVASYAAPRLGVALFTVGIVCGQLLGSLIVDRRGLSPGGARPLTPYRVIGVILSLTAVALGVLHGGGQVHPLLLLLAVLPGAGLALQQAAMGHVTAATGEPIAAAALNFTVGAAALVAGALVAGADPDTWSPSLFECVGGAIGAVCAVVMAALVARLGVLRLMLAIVAGQSIGGLGVDIIAPPVGRSPTVLTGISAVLAVIAVLISGTQRRARR
jgi:transporter family-2 protein